jgi:hypothetical protein
MSVAPRGGEDDEQADAGGLALRRYPAIAAPFNSEKDEQRTVSHPHS